MKGSHKSQSIQSKFSEQLEYMEQLSLLPYLLKWLFLSALIASLVGSASALLLNALNWAGSWREANLWIIAFLPIAGLLVGLSYHYLGSNVVKGNNQLLEEFHSPKHVIPFRMAPLILLGTVATHLFGGSAGREGTAVQMGGAIADQFTKIFKLKKADRKIIIIMGISAGFASVFGTPLAGAVFAIEVLALGRIGYEAILPSFFAAIIANGACDLWHVGHTHYSIPFVPEMSFDNFIWCIIAGILFGLTAMLFSKSTHMWGNFFKTKITYPPLRPFIGGIAIAIAVYAIGTTKYIGLGIPMIEASFSQNLNSYDFLAKLLFTSFTIGAGFKGGEVTPLFFIGATLGNVLFWIIPLPTALLAGMGFVAVFAGATNTPIACILMGIELFGADSAVYISIACVIAYLFSGHTGIYSSQLIGTAKHKKFKKVQGRTLGEQ